MKRKHVEFDLSFATYADVDDIVNILYPGYFEESTYSDLTYDPEMTKRTVIDWISEPCVIARVDGKLAGIVAMYFVRTFYKETECDVIMFYVAPEYRGTGVARGLVNALTMISDKEGAAIIYTTSGSGMTGSNNKMYTNLFSKFGFKGLGTELIRVNV